jgi:hypothetical protein
MTRATDRGERAAEWMPMIPPHDDPTQITGAMPSSSISAVASPAILDAR